jgi:hypothetical protein
MAAAPGGSGQQRWPHHLRKAEKTRVGGKENSWDPRKEGDLEGL